MCSDDTELHILLQDCSTSVPTSSPLLDKLMGDESCGQQCL